MEWCVLNLPSSCEVHLGCVAKLEPKGVGGEPSSAAAWLPPAAPPRPGLSAPQDWELWSDDVASDYFCILFIFFFIHCNGFILPLLSTPTASFMSGRKSPHTSASLSGLRKSHLCGGIISSVLLVSFWTTFQQSGPRRNLGVTPQGSFPPF